MTLKSDRIRLLLDGKEVPVAQSYKAQNSIFTVPTTFNLSVGSKSSAAQIVNQFPEWTPFEIYIGDLKIQEGETEGFSVNTSNGTLIDIFGRGLLARLVDEKLERDRSFAEMSYYDLTFKAFDEVGLGDRFLLGVNQAQSLAITGSQKVVKTAGEVEEVQQTEVSANQNFRIVHNTITAKLGTPWMTFLMDQYKKAGLFLWEDTDGVFMLAPPHSEVNASAVFRIIHRRNESNVVDCDFKRDAKKRWTRCIVHGRGGAGKDGRGKNTGEFVDDEALRLRKGRHKTEIVYDSKIRNKQEAEYVARRRIVESRRDGFELSYLIPGHETQAFDGSGRIPWKVNQVVEVIDDERGIEGNMLIHSVDFLGQGDSTMTRVALMRIEDVLYAEEVPNSDKAQRVGKGLVKKQGVTLMDPIEFSQTRSGKFVVIEHEQNEDRFF